MLRIRAISSVLPGLALCTGITCIAFAAEGVEARFLGRPYIEAIVAAILLGALVRTLWTPGPAWANGIEFSAKTLLEIAVAMLGASTSAQAITTRGPGLLLGVAFVVTASLAASYAVARGFGLSRRLSLLVACGNSICGNSAIAAVAPIIGAEAGDIVSSIAFTAILGVIVVLVLPLLVPLLELSQTQYGVLAGLTVYAVPQVLAATFPVGILSTQIGTLVKLMRVLMLGPVVLVVSVGVNHSLRNRDAGARILSLPFARFVPWFIIAFVLLAGFRSAGLVPSFVLDPIVRLASLFTVVAMAALGLNVDVRGLRGVGGRVIAAALVAILLLGGISFVLIHLLRIA